MPDDVLWRVCLHEAGHAIAWSLLDNGEVLSVTVGVENLGQVLTRRRNDMAQTETWLMQTMACLLAGRVSEQMILGNVGAGAGGDDSSDLAQATDYALAAETRLGFSRVNPLLYRNPSGSLDLLSLDRELAARVNERLISGEALAWELLKGRREDLLEVAGRLQERGIMEGCEIRQMLGLAVP
jgi:cell division protease FtsH